MLKMERSAFSRGGEFAPYTPPQMELLDITAEQGFAGSWGDGSLDDNGDNWDKDDF